VASTETHRFSQEKRRAPRLVLHGIGSLGEYFTRPPPERQG